MSTSDRSPLEREVPAGYCCEAGYVASPGPCPWHPSMLDLRPGEVDPAGTAAFQSWAAEGRIPEANKPIRGILFALALTFGCIVLPVITTLYVMGRIW
jgi:hypothetical protein